MVHTYITDMGKSNYVIDIYVVHNVFKVPSLPHCLQILVLLMLMLMLMLTLMLMLMDLQCGRSSLSQR